MYSPEDIEKKKQLALQKRRESLNRCASTVSPSTRNISNNYTNQDVNSSRIDITGSPNYKDLQNKCDSTISTELSQNRYNPLLKGMKKMFGLTPHCELACSMISLDRFSVKLFYCHDTQFLNGVFQTIRSAIYDNGTRTWNFHIKDYNSLRDKIQKINNIDFKGIPFVVLKIFKNSLEEGKNKKSVDLSSIDPTLTKSLYPFQKEGISYGISKNGKCLIGDEMGLGKTRQALGIAYYYKKNWPLIIVTPTSVRYQWSEAIMELLPSVPQESIQHIRSGKDFIDEQCKVIIISYDLLAKHIDKILEKKFGVLICDESHYIKNYQTKRTQAVKALSTKVKNIILLTGTPALARPSELYTQLKVLLPSFMKYRDFGFRYCEAHQTSYGLKDTGSSNSKELGLLLKAFCLIRRLKSDVMTELPSKIRQKILLEPSNIKNYTHEMKAAAQKMTQEFCSRKEQHKALLEYYSVTSKVKEAAVRSYIADLVENKQKFLVFAHHQNMLDAICKLLMSKKIGYIRIDGKTKSEDRKKFVDCFQSDEDILVAVLSITAASTGITLTAASFVVFAELYWTPGILRQAEDRVHRIGQTNNVVVHYLCKEKTVDDYLWPLINTKVGVLNDLGLNENLDLYRVDVSKWRTFYNQNEQNNYVGTELLSERMDLDPSHVIKEDTSIHQIRLEDLCTPCKSQFSKNANVHSETLISTLVSEQSPANQEYFMDCSMPSTSKNAFKKAKVSNPSVSLNKTNVGVKTVSPKNNLDNFDNSSLTGVRKNLFGSTDTNAILEKYLMSLLNDGNDDIFLNVDLNSIEK